MRDTHKAWNSCIKTVLPRDSNIGLSSEFLECYQVRQMTPEEGRSVQRPNFCVHSNYDKYNISQCVENYNYQNASSQKYRQRMIIMQKKKNHGFLLKTFSIQWSPCIYFSFRENNWKISLFGRPSYIFFYNNRFLNESLLNPNLNYTKAQFITWCS